MATPIDIVANAIRDSCGGQPPVGLAGPLANVAVRALTDDRIVANAAAAIEAHTETLGLSAFERNHIARVVLRSVGGGA